MKDYLSFSVAIPVVVDLLLRLYKRVGAMDVYVVAIPVVVDLLLRLRFIGVAFR